MSKANKKEITINIACSVCRHILKKGDNFMTDNKTFVISNNIEFLESVQKIVGGAIEIKEYKTFIVKTLNIF